MNLKIVIVTILCCLIFNLAAASGNNGIVRVGVFDNPPIASINSQGLPEGLAIDILEQIARQEGWTLKFVPGTLNKLRRQLARGELELLVGATWGNENQPGFNYSNESITNNWGVIYKNPAQKINSIFDLKNKRIAINIDSVYATRFYHLTRRFNIQYSAIKVKSYAEVLKAIDNGIADAGVINRLFSISNAHKYEIIATPIVFAPVNIRYASPSKKGNELLRKIDYHLSIVRADPDSWYQDAIKRWLNMSPTKRVPEWAVWVALISALMMISTFVFNWYLRLTVRQQTAELADSEYRFRQLTDNLRQVFWISSPDFEEIHYVSPAYYNTWGRSVRSLYKKPSSWLDSVHPDDKPMLLHTMHSAPHVENERVYPVFRIVRPNNTIRWIYARTYPVLDQQGNLIRIAGIFEDISEKRAAEEALYQTRTLLQAITEYSPALIYVKNANGDITMANRPVEKLFDASPGSLIGKNLYQLVQETDSNLLRQNDLMALQASGPLVVDETIQDVNGNDHNYLSIKFPLRSASSRLADICSISIDVTEHIHTKKRLHVYEQIVAASRDLMAFIGPDYRFHATNDMYRKALDKTEEEINYRPVEEMFDTAFFTEHVKPCIDLCLQGEEVNTQHWFDSPVLGRRFFDVSYVPYVSDNGEISGVVADAHDLTKMKQAESELHHHREQLEDLVTRRTAALEAANRELEAYSYSIAHDLRAPLRSVTSFSQILLDEANKKLNKKQKQYLERIIGASRYMAGLIDDILELSRITRSQFNLEPVNLSALSKDILFYLDQEDPNREVEFTIEDNMTVNADGKLIRVMLENLIRNAWKYTGKASHPQISVGSWSKNGHAIYYVKDNGAGFDMRYVDKLFKPFQRLHNRDEFEGTGIGLATVQRVVQRHGGSIWCEAKPGEGATFYFTLNESAQRH